MKRCFFAAVVAVSLCSASFWVLAADNEPLPSLKSLPKYKSNSKDFSLACAEFESDKSLNFAEGKYKYSMTLSGRLVSPKQLDVVCAREDLDVGKIEDAKGKSLRIERLPRLSDTWNAFLSQQAYVKIKNLKLASPAETIGQLHLIAHVAIAKERKTAYLPAVVMEEYQSPIPNLALRIYSLKLSSKRLLTVVLEYRRAKNSPFIEAIYAIDKDNKRIGGGRWTEGTPIGDNGKFTAEFFMPTGKAHSQFELVFCTKYEFDKIPFVVDEIFVK